MNATLGDWLVSDQLFILLQCLLAFGAPLALAANELWKLRRKPPAPVGGGDPNVVYLNRGQTIPEPASLAAANSGSPIRRAA